VVETPERTDGVDEPQPLSKNERLRQEVNRAHSTTAGEQWPWFTPSTVGGLLNDIDALTAQVEKLQRERDEAQRAVKDVHDQLYWVIVERDAEISMLEGAAEAENAKLRDVVEEIAMRHRRTTYLKPPYECQCGAIQCVYLAALDHLEER
jgi:hypothetical protein